MSLFAKSTLKNLQKKIAKLHAIYQQDMTKQNAQNEIKAQYQLAEFYKKHLFNKHFPKAEIYLLECYRAIAALDDPKAKYLCGKKLLTEGKFWANWSQNPVYGSTIHKKYAQALFEEAHAYLNAADENDYVLAKRLLGMANMHGWGVPRDINKGYQLVLDSIELEKSWDRATKIFEELKLSSPEFFAALQSYRKS